MAGPNRPLMQCEGQSLRLPIFPGAFSVQHGLSAKQADQGTNPGQDGLAEITTIPNEFRES